MTTMPILPLDTMVAGCDDEQERIVRAAFTTRGVRNKNDGYAKLRSNKPFARVTTFEQGCANYVWRMLCFDLVGSGKHACMPVTADFDISEACEIRNGGRVRYGESGYEEQRERRKDLRESMDALVKQVESVLPIEAQKGILRWGRALGMI